MAKIEDGSGKGFLMKVDSEQRALVHADTNTEEHNISHQFGKSFVINTADTANTLTLATGNTYNFMYLENKSADDLVNIQDIRVTVDTAGVVALIVRNSTLGSVSANNVTTPRNLNFGSQNAADGTFHNWDETGTTGIGGLTLGTVLEAHVLGVGSTVFLYDAALLLADSNNIVLRLVNGTGGNVEAAATIRFYYEA